MPSNRAWWGDLGHGDICVYDTGFRGVGTWVVVVNDDKTKNIEVASVVEARKLPPAGVPGRPRAPTPHGKYDDYPEISCVVSREIEDPLGFYAEAMAPRLRQGITCINFDPCAHDDLLQKLTGGRTVDNDRSVWYTPCGQIEIATPTALRRVAPGGAARAPSYTLDGETPDEILTGG